MSQARLGTPRQQGSPRISLALRWAAGEWATTRALDALAILILALVAVVAALTFRNYGLGWDDYAHAEMGELLLVLYGSGFRDTRAFSFVNLYMYGGGFDMAAGLLAKLLPFDLFETRRLVGAAFGLIGLFATWRIGRQLAGPLAGLMALAFLATCPLYYGHMFINAKDAPFAVAMAFLLLALVRLFDAYPRPTSASIVLLGVGIGATIGTRVIGVIAGLYGAAALSLVVAVEWRRLGAKAAIARSARFLLWLLPALPLAYGVMALLWPWATLAPLNPLRALEYFSHFFEKPWRELFAGALIPVPNMPWRYLPTLMGLKLPEGFIALALGGTALAAITILNPAATTSRRAAHLVILAAALFPLLVTMLTRPALYNGIRHFIFVLPPLAVLAGMGAGCLFERLARRGRIALVAGVAVVSAALALPLTDMRRLHPYEYTHFNRIAGGVAGARGRYMLDYWGLALKQAAQELRAVLTERMESAPYGRDWKIATCGPHRGAAVELGPEFETTWDPRGADFALMIGEFYCVALNAPILAEVTRDGVVYARAYDIRGRSIANLLAFPPP
jgi:Dolichyl-phosphate-mannose-protein mannosyltransferase